MSNHIHDMLFGSQDSAERQRYVEALEAFVRHQKQLAWQRHDFRTADAAADLLGEKRPSVHEGEA